MQPRRRQGRGHRAASAPSLEQAKEQQEQRHRQPSPHPVQREERAQWRAVPESLNTTDGATAELWLACRFSDLPLDAALNDTTHAGFYNPAAPLVIHDEHARQPLLVACNASAREHGLHSGMRLGVAHTLVAGLQTCMRDLPLEHLRLEQLASQAMRFSSRVVVQAPDTLLLEIGASLRLFESLEKLLTHFTQHFAWRLSLAVAPTASSAELLSQGEDKREIVAKEQLHSALASVPLPELPVSERVIKTLGGMGIVRLGDLMRLPRDGLARRVGPDVVALLDRLTGQRPDPRRYYMPADFFRSNITLTDDIINIDQLLIIADRLIDELAQRLEARSCGVHQLRWRFDHHDRSSTAIELNLSQLGKRPTHMKELMRTRTENMTLSGPVHTVTLVSSRFEQAHMQAVGLFPDLEQSTPQFDLIDRLRARLGDDSVNAITKLAEHTPEKAWTLVDPGSVMATRRGSQADTPASSTQSRQPRRPLWLMRSPLKLRCVDEQPWLNGPLELLDGPERIETGWWESNTRRDYYVALSSRGRHLWVFYDIRQRAWFVQGAFV